MHPTISICLFTLFVAGSAAAQNEATVLKQARQAIEKTIERCQSKLCKQVDEALAAATDHRQRQRLTADLEALKTNDTLPASLPAAAQAYSRTTRASFKRLCAAYEKRIHKANTPKTRKLRQQLESQLAEVRDEWAHLDIEDWRCQLDLQKHAANGQWRWQGPGFAPDADGANILELPRTGSAPYALTFELTQRSGQAPLGLVLPVHGSRERATVLLGGENDGVRVLTSRASDQDGASAENHHLFQGEQSVTVRIASVAGSIRVTVEDQLILATRSGLGLAQPTEFSKHIPKNSKAFLIAEGPDSYRIGALLYEQLPAELVARVVEASADRSVELLPEGSEWQGTLDTKEGPRGSCNRVHISERTKDRAVIEMLAHNRSKWRFVVARKGKRWKVVDVFQDKGRIRGIDRVRSVKVDIDEDAFKIKFTFRKGRRTWKFGLQATRK